MGIFIYQGGLVHTMHGYPLASTKKLLRIRYSPSGFDMLSMDYNDLSFLSLLLILDHSSASFFLLFEPFRLTLHDQ